MRMMMKVTMEMNSGNKAIVEKTLQNIIGSTMERIKPEAAYFVALDGKRTCLMFFDMKDSSEIPSIVEPLFLGLNAEVELTPAMNAEDLQKGLGAFNG